MNTQHANANESVPIPSPALAIILKTDTAEEGYKMQTALAKIVALGSSRIITEGTNQDLSLNLRIPM
jgi:hypothetical protein